MCGWSTLHRFRLRSKCVGQQISPGVCGAITDRDGSRYDSHLYPRVVVVEPGGTTDAVEPWFSLLRWFQIGVWRTSEGLARSLAALLPGALRDILLFPPAIAVPVSGFGKQHRILRQVVTYLLVVPDIDLQQRAIVHQCAGTVYDAAARVACVVDGSWLWETVP